MSLVGTILVGLAMALGLIIVLLMTIPDDKMQRLCGRLGYVHGSAGLAGVLVMLGFGVASAYPNPTLTLLALAVAAAIGVGMFFAYRVGKPPPPIVIALHAGAALLGFGLLTGAM
ncbi:MAG TPA: hypothetical protein VJY39_09035 [Acidisphaera sp.]|nr:hypothetical protein [Acidisphaera sp.]